MNMFELCDCVTNLSDRKINFFVKNKPINY